jgi:hypothetical protein
LGIARLSSEKTFTNGNPMSKYNRLEAGAVPGARDPERGPKGIYSFGMLGGTSRSLNHTERDEKLSEIDDSLINAYGDARRNHAMRYLRRLCQILTPFNLSQHEVRIGCGMGATWLELRDRRVDGRQTNVDELRSRGLVVDQLKEIDPYLEGTWEWACYLDGEVLNP